MDEPRWQALLRSASDWQFIAQIILALLAGGWVSYLAQQAQMHEYVIVFVFLGAVAFVAAAWSYVAQEIRQASFARRLIPREFFFGRTKGDDENRQIIRFNLYNDTLVPLYVKFDQLNCKIGNAPGLHDDALNRIHIIPSHQDGLFLSPDIPNAPASKEAWISAKAKFGKSPKHLNYTLEFEVTCRHVGGDKGFAHTFLHLK